MRVLLLRLEAGQRLAAGALEDLAGQPVTLDRGGRVVGRVKRAELVGGEVYADIDLKDPALPHELFVTPVLVSRLKQ